jgi:hypothetical protein
MHTAIIADGFWGEEFVRKQIASLKLINLGLSGSTISGFYMHPTDPTRTKIPSFESAYEIVLTDAKFINITAVL